MRKTILAFLMAVSAAANAQDDNYWYLAQHNGYCVSLGEAFPKMHTPDEAWRKMVAGVPQEDRIIIKHVSPEVTTFRDAFGRFPPLVMVKGYRRCHQEIEKWNNPYGY